MLRPPPLPSWPLLGLFLALPLAPLQASDGPCADRCRELGECAAQSGGRCVAMFDEDCEASEACTRFGRCAAKGGVCSAATDEACEASELCRQRGECTARDGHCEVASDDSCRASTGCPSSGRCTLGDGECIVGSSADCEGSQLCQATGACGRRGKTCVPTLDAHCAASAACADDGRCALVDGRCDTPEAEDTGLLAEDADPRDGPIHVTGGLRRNAVRKVLREVRADAVRCGPLTADVELTAAILPKGKITDIVVVGVPRKQERCIAKALKKRRLPERKRPSTLTWRLHRPD